MLALPPVASATWSCASLRLPRYHYARLDSNDYSVHPSLFGGGCYYAPICIWSRRSVTESWWPTMNGAVLSI